MPAKSSEEVEERVGKKRTRKIASSTDTDTEANDVDDNDNADDDGADDGDDHSDSDIVSSTECSNSEQDEIEPPERLDLDKCLVYLRCYSVMKSKKENKFNTKAHYLTDAHDGTARGAYCSVDTSNMSQSYSDFV